MEIPVLIEPVPGIGFRASGGGPFAIVTEGATADEALAQFKEQVSSKLQNGTRLTTINIPANEHPWLEFAGMYDPNDPLIHEWQSIIKKNRERDEAEE